MQDQLHKSETTCGSASARDASTAGATAPPERSAGADAVPLSNTGLEIDKAIPIASPENLDMQSGGERVELVKVGQHIEFIQHPIPNESAPSHAAFIDWLAFTLTPPLQHALMSRVKSCEDSGYWWMCSELVKIFNVKKNDIERQKSGGSGYKYRAKFPGGQILWGGANQRGTINVSLSGEGCSRIENWPAIQTWLEIHQAKLKRVDLTCDDITGETLTIEKMADWYRTGGFGAGGRQPSHSTPGDWLHGQASVKGRTLNVGNRTSGKMFRGYEKGKQLGDPTSRWVRAELELHDKLRVIPYDVIKRPGQYLAGGYPCLAFLNIVQSKIKTVLKAAKVAFDRAMHNARQQVGKLVNLALSVFGGDYAMVVERLRREGIPKRIEPYSYHVQQSPESLDDAECFASGTTY